MRIGIIAIGTAMLLPAFASAQEVVPAVGYKKLDDASPGKGRDLTKMPLQQRTIFLSTLRATEWLHKANKADGRFVYGFLPALRTPMDGDSFVDQAGAAYALGRAAGYFGDERAAAVAKQALLTLLLETANDPQDPQQRRTAVADELLNRVASGGILLAAIHAQPNPATDLVQSGDQIALFLHKQMQPDGTFRIGTEDPNLIHQASGLGVLGLAKNNMARPAAWKGDALKKARDAYVASWKKQPNLAMLPGHSAAYADAFAQTKDRAFADAVFEMNDWLLDLQYRDMEPRRRHWTGGFRSWRNGKAVDVAPDIQSAPCAESLAEACRVARLAGDAQRHERYRSALESSLMFLASLQYNDGAVQHYAEWFRPAILGGFHASHQDGNLRLDYAWHSLAAQVGYLGSTAE
ncbi:MAG: hypothetical protein U0744_18730 [Gemmataceae bacterium]